jgi:cytochrome c-type biogenesis protein
VFVEGGLDPGSGSAAGFRRGGAGVSSPCCLPLLPGYLGFLSGLSGDDDGELGGRRALIGASLFVLGFVVVFTTLGASASLLGSFLQEHREATFQVSGVFVVAMGGSMLVGANVPFLSRGARFDLSKMRRGPAGAFPLGMAFAFGWTPASGRCLRLC